MQAFVLNWKVKLFHKCLHAGGKKTKQERENRASQYIN